MAYIRSAANPEKLYVWADEKHTHFWVGTNVTRRMTNRVFKELLSKYIRGYRYVPCITSAASITETEDFKIRIDARGWKHSIVMWEVTWEYIVTSFKERQKIG